MPGLNEEGYCYVCKCEVIDTEENTCTYCCSDLCEDCATKMSVIFSRYNLCCIDCGYDMKCSEKEERRQERARKQKKNKSK